MRRDVVVLAAASLLVGCTRKPAETVPQLAEEFVYRSLAFSPASATTVGYHEHQGARLDEMLDDYGQNSIEQQRRFYREFRERLAKAGEAGPLSPQDSADYDILSDQAAFQLLELDEIRSYQHNPTLYVELIGNALYSPFVLEYAPKPQRYGHIIARLNRIPGLLEQAKGNLTGSPEVWTKVAGEENEGNIALADKMLREGAPAELRPAYDKAVETALVALRGFSDYLKNDLSKRPIDWRLGKEKYAKKFRYVLQTGLTPEQVLAAAEADLARIRRQMFELSLPLHHKWYPSHKDPVNLNLIIGETLAKISARHGTRETYFADARRDLAETRDFVRAKDLVPLPPQDNLQVIETPEFMRGVYGVGGFAPAPALEPQLGAFYWITPIPKTWPRGRVESKLREYNFHGLKLLTIHEAMPGHYVQSRYANAMEPKLRRLLRAVFGSGSYVEGWAVYATEMMLDKGYLGGSPELRLTFQKQQLRMIANAILDVRLQTMGMTDQEAMDLMLNKGFQEKEEASAKLQRAKLTSCQLPTYFAGWRDWIRVREQYRAAKGTAFRLSEFHQRALEEGAVPLPVLARILTGKPL